MQITYLQTVIVKTWMPINILSHRITHWLTHSNKNYFWESMEEYLSNETVLRLINPYLRQESTNYSMNRIWWNAKWKIPINSLEFRSVEIPSYSVHTVSYDRYHSIVVSCRVQIGRFHTLFRKSVKFPTMWKIHQKFTFMVYVDLWFIMNHSYWNRRCFLKFVQLHTHALQKKILRANS